MASIGRVVAVMVLTGGCMPLEWEFGHQYLELWYGIWRTASGVAARCPFLPCCGSSFRARSVRSAYVRVHTLQYLHLPLPCLTDTLPYRRAFCTPPPLPPPRILDDRIYDKRHCCRARAMRPSSPPGPTLCPCRWPMPATLFAVECLPTHALSSSACRPAHIPVRT